MRLRIKYCGGCNAAYDRVKFVKQLKEALEANMPGEWEISYDSEPAQQGVLVCGCSVLCADRDLDTSTTPTWHVIGPDLLDYQPLPNEKIICKIVSDLKEKS